MFNFPISLFIKIEFMQIRMFVFLVKYQSPDYKGMLDAFHEMGVKISQNTFSPFPLGLFPFDCGKTNDEHGERFHQTKQLKNNTWGEQTNE